MLNNYIYKVCLLFFSLLILIIGCTAQVSAVAVQNVEIKSKINEEILIYLDKVTSYSITENATHDQLIIKMANKPEYSWVNEIAYKSKLISNATLINELGEGSTLLIDFSKPMIYSAQTMVSPKRVLISVIDPQYSFKETKLTEGVLFKTVNFQTFSGKVRAYVVDIAPEADYKLQTLLDGKVIGRTKLSKFANRVDILAAVNGSYFASNGEIIGALKIDNTIVSSDKIPRAIAGFAETGELLININQYIGKVALPDKTSINIDYVNRTRYSDSLVLYNKKYGETTLTNVFGSEYIVVDNTVIAIGAGNSTIPVDGIVLSASGSAQELIKQLQIGDKVTINETLGAELDSCYDAIGAGPQLIKDGKIAITTKQEKVLPDIAVGRAPRTAIAETNKKHLLLVVVDGRQHHSIGMSLTELAEFLLKLSADKAMNLDGGGSSEILVNGRVLSLPSDGSERAVASAIAVVRK